ncbi:MAG: hypothetical protein KC416_17250, partial [Myxococcales bacterium]|nr:hypothetical protein [Myxococcales bacterium]
MDDTTTNNAGSSTQVTIDEAIANHTESETKTTRSRTDNELPYKVICISLYKEDLARLDTKVASLKGSGHRKMNRSA